MYWLFFSSRRRHTRYWRDWSSDVCSSDLPVLHLLLHVRLPARRRPGLGGGRPARARVPGRRHRGPDHAERRGAAAREIGRASCRERVYISVVAVSLKKKRIAVLLLRRGRQ